jgi:hypothetical protein
VTPGGVVTSGNEEGIVAEAVLVEMMIAVEVV